MAKFEEVLPGLRCMKRAKRAIWERNMFIRFDLGERQIKDEDGMPYFVNGIDLDAEDWEVIDDEPEKIDYFAYGMPLKDVRAFDRNITDKLNELIDVVNKLIEVKHG